MVYCGAKVQALGVCALAEGVECRLTMDLLLLNVAVLIPTSRPLESRRAPPEFPLLMAASVCAKRNS